MSESQDAPESPSRSNYGFMRWIVIVLLFAGPGCASYFRTGQMSPEELKQRNAERSQDKRNLIQPTEHDDDF